MATNPPTPSLSTSSGSTLSHSVAIALYVGVSILGLGFLIVLVRLIFAWAQRFKLFQGNVQELPVTLSETVPTYSLTSLQGSSSPPPPYPGNSPPPSYTRDPPSIGTTDYTITVNFKELASKHLPHHKDSPSEELSNVSENPAAE